MASIDSLIVKISVTAPMATTLRLRVAMLFIRFGCWIGKESKFIVNVDAD